MAKGGCIVVRIGILEDEAAYSERLLTYLKQYQTENPDFSYTTEIYTTGIALLTKVASQFDLLFLDIQMPDMTGIEVARRIREKDESVMILFTTNYSQYAIDGYSVGAFDYMLKPLSYQPFSSKLSRALRILSYIKDRVELHLKTKQGSKKIPADEVQYIEVFAHDLHFYTDSEEIKIWGSLSEYEKKLEKAHFARCNVSYLVNLRYVKEIQGSEVLVGKHRLPISRAKRKEFLAAFAQYKGGSL